MKGRFFQVLIGVAALLLAAAAAYFSVFGLSKLFAGASLLVIIMASALEFGKIIAVSFIYRYWKKVPVAFRAYFTTGVVALMLITSMGIYGFLSSAYQQTASKDAIQNSEVAVYDLKKNRFDESRTYYMTEKSELDQSISDLRKGLANNVIQYTDTTGQLITTTSASTRRALQSQLEDAMNRRDNVSKKIETVTDSLGYYDRKIYELESTNELSNELGPLKYLSNVLDIPMERVVNWLILLIIFVFDPMAIALIVAFNYIGMDITSNKNLEKSKEIVILKENKEEVEEKIIIDEAEEIESESVREEVRDLPELEIVVDEQKPEEEVSRVEEPESIVEVVVDKPIEEPKLVDKQKITDEGLKYLKEKYKETPAGSKKEPRKVKPIQRKVNWPGMQPDGSIKN